MNNLKPPTGAGLSRGCLILFAIPWTIFSCFWTGAVFAGTLAAFQQEGGFSIFALIMPLFGLPFIAIGLGMLGAGIWPWIAGIRAAKPTVTISNNSVRVGDGFVVGYSQIFKRAAEVKHVALSLVFRETARYRQGSSTSTVTRDTSIAEYEYPGRTMEAGDQLVFSRSLEIPCDGMHSFAGAHNQLAWLLRVKVEIAQWPDYQEEFEILVQPILA